MSLVFAFSVNQRQHYMEEIVSTASSRRLPICQSIDYSTAGRIIHVLSVNAKR